MSTDSQGRSPEPRQAGQSGGAPANDGPARARRPTEAEAERHRDGAAVSVAPGCRALSRGDSKDALGVARDDAPQVIWWQRPELQQRVSDQ